MKKLLLFSACTAICIFVAAQAPQYLPWQGVIRDTGWNILSNQPISLRFTIHDSTATGTTLYQETHTDTTNKLGAVTEQIGAGTTVTGAFSSINWATHAKYLQVELDPAGGATYTNMGTAQMLSVPYALSAGSGGGSLTGTAAQVPYFNGSGAIHTDSLFTRNDSTYATQISRATGAVKEGFSLGAAIGGVVPDGAFISRTDTLANHYDYIGEGNFSSIGAPNGIGLFCTRQSFGSGPFAYMAIVDSAPANTIATITVSNADVTAFAANANFTPTKIGINLNNGSAYGSGIVFDTAALQLIANNITWNWPTTDGTTGQALTTDGSGNLSWAAAGGGAGWGLTGNAGTNPALNFIGTTDNTPLQFKTNDSLCGIFTPDGSFATITNNQYMMLASGNLSAIGLKDSFAVMGNYAGGTYISVDANSTRPIVKINAASNGGIVLGAYTEVDNKLSYIDGNQATGYVLTSDSLGNANWQTPTVNGATGSEPSSPYLGQFYFDTTLVKMKFWNGSAWAVITSTP